MGKRITNTAKDEQAEIGQQPHVADVADAKRTAASIDSTPDEKPAEESAAVALLEALQGFAEGIPNRSVLTDADNQALDQLLALTEDYIAAATSAWNANEYDRQTIAPEKCRALVPRVADFVVDTRSNEVHTLSSGRRVEVPSIASPAIRAHFEQRATEISVRIVDAIEIGRRRLRVEANRREDEHGRVAEWLQVPAAAHLIHELVALQAMAANGKAVMTPFNNTLDALHAMFSRLDKTDGASRRLPIRGGQWRRWLTVAERMIAETSQRAGDGGETPAA